MEQLNSTTKKAQRYIEMYKRSKETRLINCYKTQPSTRKTRAEALLLEEMCKDDGYDFRIISHSHFYFSCGWRTAEGAYRIETPSHSYLITDLPF